MAFFRRLDRPLVLASSSPRRKEILLNMGMAFSVVAPTIENEAAYLCNESLQQCLCALADAKAASVAKRLPNALVLGADTVVAVDSTVLGKPSNRTEAHEFLKQLSNRDHFVHTAVALTCNETSFKQISCATTTVSFRSLSNEEIETYLDCGSYADKAGAYGIQEGAMTFVRSISGCYYNVVGLPIETTIQLFSAYMERKE